MDLRGFQSGHKREMGPGSLPISGTALPGSVVLAATNCLLVAGRLRGVLVRHRDPAGSMGVVLRFCRVDRHHRHGGRVAGHLLHRVSYARLRLEAIPNQR